MKDAILSILQETMQANGLVVKPADNADLIGEAVFLDDLVTNAKVSVPYSVLLSADMRDQTVYLYELADDSNDAIPTRKVKRILSKPFGKKAVDRLSLGDIPKAMKAALGEDWKVKSVNSVQKVEFAKGGFELFQDIEPEGEAQIPTFKTRVETTVEPPPLRLERTDVNLYYLVLVVLFMLAGMVLDIASMGYIVGLAVWVFFLYLHRRFKGKLTYRIASWTICLLSLTGIVYLTMAK